MMESDDPEFQKLLSEYSFSDSRLQSHYLGTSSDVTSENIMLGKIFALALFRRFCIAQRIEAPFELMIFSSKTMSTMETYTMREFLRWTPEAVTESVQKEIEAVFPDVPWMTKYFTTCGFPALFGHFVAREYVKAGCVFIRSCIRDDLAPRLLGCYLAHCFVFRDRLKDAFMQMYFSEKRGGDDLEILAQSVEFCACYVSSDHVDIVKEMREVSEEKACQAVCRYFLAKVVKLWAYDGMMRISGFGKGDLVQRIKRLRPEDEAARRILGAFKVDAVTECPEVRNLVYYGGVNFAVSEVDLVLLHMFVNCRKRVEGKKIIAQARGNAATAAQDVFTVRQKFSVYPENSDKLPTPTETSQKVTKKKLLEMRERHKALFRYSGDLKQFLLAIDAQKRTLPLVNAHLAEALEQVGNPCDFVFDHYVSYALTTFMHCLPSSVRLFMEKEVKDSPDVVHGNKLQAGILNEIRENDDPVSAVLTATGLYMDKWKLAFNDCASQPVDARKTNLKKTNGLRCCEFYMHELSDLGYSLMLRTLSQTKSEFLMDCQDEMLVKLETLVNANSVEKNIGDVHSLDFETSGAFGSDVISMLNTMNDRAKHSFQSNSSNTCEGDWISGFLELQALLETPMDVSFVYVDPPMKVRMLLSLIRGNSVFIRGMLLKCALDVRLLAQSEHVALEKLRLIQNPFKLDVYPRFVHLCRWLGFKNIDDLHLQ